MKKKILIGICTTVLLVIIYFGSVATSIFLIGSANMEVEFSKIEVLSDKLNLMGKTKDIQDAFRGYKYSIIDNNAYVTLNFVRCSKLYQTNNFDIEINDEFSKIGNLYLIDGMEKKLIWNKETDGVQTAYMYKGNYNADGIEIDNSIIMYVNNSLLTNLEIIKNYIISNRFNGIDIEIQNIDEGNILTVNLKDKERFVTEYIDAGSSGSKIYLDILKYSFLQPEADLKNWIGGVKFLLNGKENTEGSHFNFEGVFQRERLGKTLAYITDYGYEGNTTDYKTKFILNENAQKFVIDPIEGTEIIINEVSYDETGFSFIKELFRTTKKMLFSMELPEGLPYIEVKLVKADRSSSWFPSFNGRDGTLVAPEEFKIIEFGGISRNEAIEIAKNYLKEHEEKEVIAKLINFNNPDIERIYEYRDYKISNIALKDKLCWVVYFKHELGNFSGDIAIYIDYYTSEVYGALPVA